jgi:rhomboid family GlyGly-CTERM serine protease
MADSTSHLIGKQAVGWPILVVALALSIYLVPNASKVLVYDRSAILSGELWRLITGHWVHFSYGHLFYDVIVLAITGWIIKHQGYRYLTSLCLLTSVSISLMLFILLPDMARYGGLSGIAMASTVYLSIHCLNKTPPWRRAGLLIILLCIGKLAFDTSASRFALLDFEGEVVPVYLSHHVGAICGLVVYLWSAINRSYLFLQPEKS